MGKVFNMVGGGGGGSIVSIIVDVDSAANDTVYYYYNNDTSTTPVVLCTTNSSGKGTGEIVFPQGQEIYSVDFYSTVAKATDLTSPYKKTLNLTPLTNSISIMPNKALYWYGNQCTSITGGWNAITSQYASNKNVAQVTFCTNSIEIWCTSSGIGASGGVYSYNQILTSNEKLHMRACGTHSGTSGQIQGCCYATARNQNVAMSNDWSGVSGGDVADTVSANNWINNMYLNMMNYTNGGTAQTIYYIAVWLE